MSAILIGVWVFFAYVAIDALYALYTLAVTNYRPARAATISSVMYLLLATGFLAFTHNAWYLMPAAAGGWIGTFLTVRLEKHKSERAGNQEE